ncbi:MAG: LytTR family DNA-binding domain-containing protein [Blautia wexlerae]
MEILPKDIFVQCHRCYIVSLYAVRSIRRFEITLNNHEIIPVSKYSYRDVQEQLQQYAAKWFFNFCKQQKRGCRFNE